MSCDLPLVTPGTLLREIQNIILKKKVRGLPVVNDGDGGRLVGVIAREDLIQVPEDRWDQMTAGEAMSGGPPIVIGHQETLDEALTLMSDHDIGLLPVVAAGKKLLGAVSRRAVLRSFLGAVRHVGEEAESRSLAE